MHDSAMRDHLIIVELLPDFVLGKLDETTMRRVSRHLETCDTCRGECANAMAVLGSLADVAPPPVSLRDAILRRAPALRPAATRQVAQSNSAPQRQSRVAAQGRHGPPFGRPLPRWALAASAAVVFIATGLAGWSVQHRAPAAADDRIQALVSDPAAAYPLDDSDIDVAATGVVFAEPTGREVYLVANGLPVLRHDQRYQVWLFTAQDKLVSAGLVTAQPDGELRALLQTPDPFVDYVGVGITAEPQNGSSAPTSDLVLGGSFSPVAAEVPPMPAIGGA